MLSLRVSLSLSFALSAVAMAACFAASAADAATAPRLDTPSGYPVPRLVSLRYAKTPCRGGPSQSHAVAVTYLEPGTPFRVIAESQDHWIKVQDFDGAQCWMRQTSLKARSHVLVRENETELRASPSGRAAVRVRLLRGVLLKVESRSGDYVRVSGPGGAGWVAASAVWGLSVDDTGSE